jgi:hypothetical protein
MFGVSCGPCFGGVGAWLLDVVTGSVVYVLDRMEVGSSLMQELICDDWGIYGFRLEVDVDQYWF